ncbi:MAG: hypothetical protein K1X89_14645 [Myxococcaceae bacterium]|nr:hypothetical protein [Myxococcaceae bacterium]
MSSIRTLGAVVVLVGLASSCGPSELAASPTPDGQGTVEQHADARCPPDFWTQDCSHSHGLCKVPTCHLHLWTYDYSAEKGRCFLKKTDTYVCAPPLPNCGGCTSNAQCPAGQECHQKVVGDPTNPVCTTGICKERRNASAERLAIVPVTPFRIVDTRSNGERLSDGEWRQFAVPRLPSWATAMVINVTVVDPDGAGFVSVSAENVVRASTLNFGAFSTTANLTVVGLDAGGQISAVVGGASADVVMDVVGYTTLEGAADWNRSLWFNSITPIRLLDTRASDVPTMVCAGSPVKVNVGHPASPGLRNARSLFANITVVSPTASTFVRAYAWGSSPPGTSSVNAAAGAGAVPNLALVNTAPDEFGNRSIAVEVGAGCAHVVVDAMGYFTPDGEPVTVLPTPQRTFDSRTWRPLGAGETIVVGPIASGLSGGMFNLTVTAPAAAGFLSIYPADSEFPGTSNLNFSAGETRAVMAATRLDGAGRVKITNGAPGPVHVILDQLGGFTPDPRF